MARYTEIKYYNLFPKQSENGADRLVARVFVPSHSRTIIYGKKPYFVKFPDLIFNITFTRYFAGRPWFRFDSLYITSPDGHIPLLPNTESNGYVCLGQGRPSRNSAKDLIDVVLKRFYTARFNKHFPQGSRIEFEENLKHKKIELSIVTLNYFHNLVEAQI